MAYAEAEVIIDAPIEHVWQTMLETDRYSEWNPFITRIDTPAGGPRVGADLILHVQFSNGMRAKTRERITRLEPPAPGADGVTRAHLQYIFLGPLHALYLVRGQRPQTVEALDANRCRYHTGERLYGLLAALAPIRQVQDGFERHAAALKRRCEQRPD
jgi:hypothetical protein